MAKIDNTTKALQRQTGIGAIKATLEEQALKIEQAVPANIALPFPRIMAATMASLRAVPQLMNCTPQSILGSVITAASLGLQIGGPMGECYIIPYGQQAQFQMGYKGFAQLFWRWDGAAGFDFNAVRENDTFEWSMGSSPFVDFRPLLGTEDERGKLVAAYMVAHVRGGAVPLVKVIGPDRIATAKRISKTSGRSDSPWNKHEEAMWAKTAVHAGAKLLPKVTELYRAAILDQAIDQGRIAPSEQVASGKLDAIDAEFATEGDSDWDTYGGEPPEME